MNKRGLSPVIATVLLVGLAIVLALIVFLWARTIIGESVAKQGSDIANSCPGVDFDAEAYHSEDKISIVNRGNVPLYGVVINKKRVVGGSVEKIETFTRTIGSGETAHINNIPIGLEAGDTIILTPILLGETETELKAHICEENYGVEVLIQS